mgnify:CR=1 FL=1
MNLPELNYGSNLKIFFWLFVISIFLNLILFLTTKGKILFPGDYFRVVGGHRVFIPFGGVLIMTIVSYFVLTTQLLWYLLAVVSLYIIAKLLLGRKIF